MLSIAKQNDALRCFLEVNLRYAVRVAAVSFTMANLRLRFCAPSLLFVLLLTSSNFFAFKFHGGRPLANFVPAKSYHQLYSDPSSEAAASAAYEFMQAQGEWYSMGGCSVLLPREKIPKSIIHFVGGFVAGSAVTVTYGRMLATLANSGHLIVATPIPAVDLNHGGVANDVTTAFTNCYRSNVLPLLGKLGPEVPVFGLSHSLGGKLVVLMNSKKEARKSLPPRAGNIFLAFNNYGVQENIELGRAQAAKASPEVQKILDAVSRPEVQKMFQTAKDNKIVSDVFSSFFKNAAGPAKPKSEGGADRTAAGGAGPTPGDILNDAVTNLGNQLGIDIAQKVAEFTNDASDRLEFTPSSEETWQLLLDGYNIQKNILVKFDDDEIDQSIDLAVNLRKRGCDANIRSLSGNHLTPNVLVSGVGGDTASAPFLSEMVNLFNRISDDAWVEIERRRSEKFKLPAKASI